jgi:excisionase family DNA binding protein
MDYTAEPWVSIADVAAHLGVRRDSVYRWIGQRGLPATKVGKLWKMKLSEVDAWMRDRAAGSATSAGPGRDHGGDAEGRAAPLGRSSGSGTGERISLTAGAATNRGDER